ncbi:MAG: HD domain-containing protein, partial [Anaerotignum sp.]|nr:HD domain-containing protein [Anaerotignum sp.]
MDRERFENQMAFILEADKEKNILRQTHLSGGGRQENDAEHAWHMAMMIYLLKEYANEPFDLAKTMMMALIHDIVEIDAGDTYAYDAAAMETQAERERLAADRIFGMLPDDQREELRGLFEEFEAGEKPEAKFARTMDNLQPLMLNDSNNGGDWREHKVTKSQVMKRHRRNQLGSAVIGEY